MGEHALCDEKQILFGELLNPRYIFEGYNGKKCYSSYYEWQGKIEITARAKANDKESLSLAYTPGVAEPCLEIQKDINKSYPVEYCCKERGKRKGMELHEKFLICNL